MIKPAIAIHGGAGTILRSLMTAELEQEYRTGLNEGLAAGWQVLDRGGSALDAVEAAVRSLEDFPLFNAGRGSVFTHEGKNEMDASIMDGSKPAAGCVAYVRNVKNPISLARLVMERTEHVLLAGEGASQFAREAGVDIEDDPYFFTEHRYQQLLEAKEQGVVQLDHAPGEPGPSGAGAENANITVQSRRPMGTVGAVACDSQGGLAAATSTGGMTNKKYGRIGDTALIGAGTYADDICAISCTGHGEYFMLGVTAYDVAARMRYKGISLREAADEAIARLTEINGEGGLIAVDRNGNVVLPFNSDGMYRAYVVSGAESVVEIYD